MSVLSLSVLTRPWGVTLVGPDDGDREVQAREKQLDVWPFVTLAGCIWGQRTSSDALSEVELSRDGEP